MVQLQTETDPLLQNIPEKIQNDNWHEASEWERKATSQEILVISVFSLPHKFTLST